MQQGFMAEKVLGYQQIGAGIAAAAGFTLPAGTEFVEVTVGAQAVRWRADGTDPTAAIGMPLAVGATKIFTTQQLSLVKFIEQVAGAVLDITYYGH